MSIRRTGGFRLVGAAHGARRLAAVLALAVLGGACADGASAGDAAAGERRAALLYSAAAESARGLQDTFLAEWKRSREAATVGRLRATGRERVLPALGRYIAALEAMPVGGTRLGPIHARLVASWRQFRGRLVGYYERVDADNLPKRNARLQAAWTELGARIVAYRGELRGVYDTLRLRLPGEGEPPDGGAGHE